MFRDGSSRDDLPTSFAAPADEVDCLCSARREKGLLRHVGMGRDMAWGYMTVVMIDIQRAVMDSGCSVCASFYEA